MPLQNRVSPFSTIHADPAQGLFMGNRGILHDSDGKIRRNHAHKAWICCLTTFRDRSPRPLMAPNCYTELFFLDEATALAAGHRPCAECRRADYLAFCAAWERALGPLPDHLPRAAAIDALLHDARYDPASKAQRRHRPDKDDLPSGAMIVTAAGPALFWDGHLWDWSFAGYQPATAKPPAYPEVLTPAPIMAILRAGYRPVVHPSASA